MKVIVDRAALLEAVGLTAGVAAHRSPRPQLQCIHLKAMRGEKDSPAGVLSLAATDMEIGVRIGTAQVDVQSEGAALVLGDKFRSIIQAEDGEPTLTIEADGDRCTIRGQDAKFTVFGYPASEFPDVAGVPKKEHCRDVFTVEASVLGDMVSRTIFSTARENSRYAINGVLMKRTGKKLEMVATDGRRLALSRGTAEDVEGDGSPCIVPTKALNLVNKLLAGSGSVKVYVTDNQAVFVFDGDGEGGDSAIVATNLVEGTFPPYEEVIPRDQDKKATFDVGTLASAVRRAALLTNEESRGVRMSFDSGDKTLRLSSRAPELGESEVQVDIAGYDGDSIEIGFNPAFISDALKVVEEDQVVIEMKAPNRPGLLKAGSDFVYVVMPVNLQ
ncbi:MAG: DNA polymerase III subunit beta [Phycisphaerales bacterium]